MIRICEMVHQLIEKIITIISELLTYGCNMILANTRIASIAVIALIVILFIVRRRKKIASKKKMVTTYPELEKLKKTETTVDPKDTTDSDKRSFTFIVLACLIILYAMYQIGA